MKVKVYHYKDGLDQDTYVMGVPFLWFFWRLIRIDEIQFFGGAEINCDFFWFVGFSKVGSFKTKEQCMSFLKEVVRTQKIDEEQKKSNSLMKLIDSEIIDLDTLLQAEKSSPSE